MTNGHRMKRRTVECGLNHQLDQFKSCLSRGFLRQVEGALPSRRRGSIGAVQSSRRIGISKKESISQDQEKMQRKRRKTVTDKSRTQKRGMSTGRNSIR